MIFQSLATTGLCIKYHSLSTDFFFFFTWGDRLVLQALKDQVSSPLNEKRVSDADEMASFVLQDCNPTSISTWSPNGYPPHTKVSSILISCQGPSFSLCAKNTWYFLLLFYVGTRQSQEHHSLCLKTKNKHLPYLIIFKLAAPCLQS